MSRGGYVIGGPRGAIRIEGDALAALVVAAAELVDGARVRRPKRGVDVAAADGRVRVGLELAARYGTVLPKLARDVQARVSETLRDSTGLQVDAVDVSIEELDR
ncbi:MAG: Asp23 family, cell envelope-related function [Gaiellaceae bacterium]|jgi:uncharacterized alkaline shock family protein YloU|nr:Asp23 family, cell envelope-related function [Gaiellaceae bacterium]